MSRESNEKKAVKLQAQLPTIIAAIARVRQGKEPVAPKAGVSIAENFLYMLRGEDPDQTSIKALDQALVLHADHELNASTFLRSCNRSHAVRHIFRCYFRYWRA